ncbi:hypothetical protein A2U01_0084315, partial [Trifolium medium]|nr:hypothetical protein [Trifolium medium]
KNRAWSPIDYSSELAKLPSLSLAEARNSRNSCGFCRFISLERGTFRFPPLSFA